MQNPLNQIVSSVFGESRLEDVSLDALQLLTVKYPFSAPVHLLYARRLKDLGDSRYAEAVSIAALHYANPHWLQHQLAVPLFGEGFLSIPPADGTELLAEAEAEDREMEASPPDDADSGHDLADDNDSDDLDVEAGTLPGANPSEADTNTSDVHSESPGQEPPLEAGEALYITEPPVHLDARTEDSESPSEGFTEGARPADARVAEEAVDIAKPPLVAGEALDITEPPVHQDARTEVSESPSEGFTEGALPADARVAEEAVEIAEPPAIAEDGAYISGSPSEILTIGASPEASRIAEEAVEIDAHSVVSGGSGIESEKASEILPSVETDTGITTLYEEETSKASRQIGDSELIHVTMPDPDTGSDGGLDAPVIGYLSEASGASEEHGISGEDRLLPRDPAETPGANGEGTWESSAEGQSSPVADKLPLAVEPLHLSDYLASQGIFVSSELESKGDGMGERSFTGWLRTMKRLQPDRSAPLLSVEEEDAIRSEAEASNLDEDVVTEAMAEVYARQGLVQKAIDIYEKLSLLDPDRTSTFTHRISQLKALLT